MTDRSPGRSREVSLCTATGENFVAPQRLRCPLPSHECRQSLPDPPDPPYEGGDSGWSPLNNSKAWRIRRLAGATARLHWRSLLSQTVKHFFPPLRKAGPRGSPRARRGFPVSEINAGAFGCGRRTGQALCGLFLPQRAQRSQRRETERSASCASKRISVRFCGSFCA
jgi:hypothetical protein